MLWYGGGWGLSWPAPLLLSARRLYSPEDSRCRLRSRRLPTSLGPLPRPAVPPRAAAVGTVEALPSRVTARSPLESRPRGAKHARVSLRKWLFYRREGIAASYGEGGGWCSCERGRWSTKLTAVVACKAGVLFSCFDVSRFLIYCVFFRGKKIKA